VAKSIHRCEFVLNPESTFCKLIIFILLQGLVCQVGTSTLVSKHVTKVPYLIHGYTESLTISYFECD
jgi:hypothetical protein